MWERVIAHIDMDAFFASVEIRDDPQLRGRPIAVGGIGARGVVSTASYEARRFGVHSAMPMARALSLCPDLIVLPGRHSHYSAVSREVMAVLDTFSPVREAVSVDEAYLDLTGAQRRLGSPEDMAVAIRQAVWDAVRLTCSVGVGQSKSVAKIASAHRKPHGITVVKPEETREFLAPLPVGAIGGVGPQAQKKCADLGIATVGELAELPLSALRRIAGNGAPALLDLARGVDHRPVGSSAKDKSIGKERTFHRDVADVAELRSLAASMADEVSFRVRSSGFRARTVSIKMRAPDGRTITRSLSFPSPVRGSAEFRERALLAFERAYREIRVVRLLGVRAEHLVPEASVSQQSDLAGVVDAWDGVDQAVDHARHRFGRGVIQRGSTLRAPAAPAADGTDDEQ